MTRDDERIEDIKWTSILGFLMTILSPFLIIILPFYLIGRMSQWIWKKTDGEIKQ